MAGTGVAEVTEVYKKPQKCVRHLAEASRSLRRRIFPLAEGLPNAPEGIPQVGDALPSIQQPNANLG